MNDRLHVLGVRHHGPGSAASVLRTLDLVRPEIVLIEGPPEADGLLPLVRQGLVPPVALLVHAHDDPAVASFFPFAAFSPEWVAVDWALRNRRQVRLVDLPAAVRIRDDLEARKAAEAAPQAPAGHDHEDLLLGDEDGDDEHEEDEPLDDPSLDPLGHLARLDGYPDGEAWWSRLIEESPGDPAVFRHIEDAMATLRDAMPPSDTPEARREARREATMRQHVRAAMKEADGAVAVVVGAWHAPMVRPDALPVQHDRGILKGLAKAKVVATWVPWTFSRLSTASGYRAGVHHPAWYDTLWQTRHQASAVTQAATRFQVRVATVLRDQGHLAPPSSVIDAVRLTEGLSAVRGLARPGLAELQDAAVATLCHGEPTAWRIVEERLLIGDRVGRVPDTVPQMPLAADLARQQKRLKLKPTGLDTELRLDLRSTSGGARSVLLHRLILLEIPWGRLADAGRSRGTFRENWVLRWDPEHAVSLAEALPWGTTILEAAGSRAMHHMREADDPSVLADLVRQALLSQLEQAAQVGVERLQAVTATASDLAALARAVPPLVDTQRYGTARQLPTTGLANLVEGLVDRTVLGLGYGSRDLEAEAAVTLRNILVSFDQALARHADGARLPDWYRALAGVARDEHASPLLMGFATRRLSDAGAWPDTEVAAALASSLSPGFPLARAAAWLEGFLGEAGLVLLHDPHLHGLIDQWLVSLSDEDLLEALPLFRRATSHFSDHQRAQLIARARGQAAASSPTVSTTTTPAYEAGVALLTTILGLEQS